MVCGDCVGRFLDGVAQGVLFDREAARLGEVREGRKFVFGEAVEFESGLSALDGGDVSRVGIDADIA